MSFRELGFLAFSEIPRPARITRGLFVARYRTVIVIPSDRTIVLHLPAHIPEGRAIVTVHIDEDPDDPDDHDPDRQDIEWWDEFDEQDEIHGA